MSSPSHAGVWSHPSLDFPAQDEFMCIDEERGRIVTFIVLSIDPAKRSAMRNWYRWESATVIATRLGPDKPWILHDFQIENERLMLTYRGQTFGWRRLAPHEYPDWLAERLAAAHTKMDAMDPTT